MRQGGLGNTDEPWSKVVARPPLVFVLRMSSTITHKNFPGRIHKAGYHNFSYYNYGYLKSKPTRTWAKILRLLEGRRQNSENEDTRIQSNCKYWQLVLWVHYGDYVHPTRHTKNPTEHFYIRELITRINEWAISFAQIN